MNSDETETSGSAQSFRVSVSFPVVLVAFAAGLIVFAPRDGKMTGAAFILLAMAVVARDTVVERVAATRPGSLLRDWLTRVGEVTGRLAPRLAPAVFAAGALGTLVPLVLFYDEWPGTFAMFLGGIGLTLTICAVVWPWTPKLIEHAVARRSIGGVAIALAVTAVGGLAWIVLRYATNIPFLDEIHATLNYVVQFPSMTWSEAASGAFGPHYSHRIGTTRLTALAQRYVFGEVNFYHLIWISFAYFVGSVFLIYRSLPPRVQLPVIFAPLLIVLFQPQYHQLTLWAFSIPHFACLFFCTATFVLLQRGGRATFLAIVTFLLAAYSFGSGLLAGLVALIYLIEQRRFREATYWLFPLTFVVMTYFVDNSISIYEDRAAPTFGWVAPTTADKIWCFFDFTGAAATLGIFSNYWPYDLPRPEDWPAVVWLARVTAGLFLVGVAYLTLRRYWRVNLPVYGLILTTLLSAALVAQARAFIPDTAFLSRYAINSALLGGLLYLGVAELHSTFARRAAPFAVVAAAVFCALSYAVNLPYAREHAVNLRYAMVEASSNIYQSDIPLVSVLNGYVFYPVLVNALAAGVYTIPLSKAAAEFQTAGAEVNLAAVPERPQPWKLLHVGENAEFYTFFVGPGSPTDAGDGAGSPQIVIQSGSGHARAFPTIEFNPQPSRALATFGHRETVRQATRLVCVAKSELPSGVLDVALMSADSPVGLEHASIQLPTITPVPSRLAALELPVAIHKTADVVRLVELPEGRMTIRLSEETAAPDIPERFSVEVLMRPNDAALELDVLVWELASSLRTQLKPSPNEQTTRLVLSKKFLAVQYWDGEAWKETSRLPVVADVWNWSCVSFDGTTLLQMGCEYESATNSASKLFLASGNPTRRPVTGRAHLMLGSIASPATMQLREIRILGGEVLPGDVADHWPIFNVE